MTPCRFSTCIFNIYVLTGLKWGFGLAGVSCLAGTDFRCTPAAGRKVELNKYEF
jgi:hypothetical protein